MLQFSLRIVLLSFVVFLTACGGGGDGAPPAGGGGGGVALLSPANVKAIAGDGQVTVSWNVVTDATSYTVYWNTEGSVTTSDNTIDAAGNAQILHSSLAKGKTYYYAVTASNSSEESVLSEGISTSQPIWQWSNPLPLGSGMSASASNGSKIVAVGSYGAILSSVDGISWTTELSGTRQALYSIVWNGNKFVTVGSSGTILTSADGVIWTVVQTDKTDQHLKEVIWNGSEFAAVGGDGVITSADGMSWTTQTTGVVGYYEAIVWDDTQYVVVGKTAVGGDLVITSSDGISWTVQTSGNDNWLYGIAWDGTKLVAVGQLGTVMTSADAITWSIQGDPAGLSQPALIDVTYDGAQFVAVGSGFGDTGVIITSADGLTWVSKTTNTDAAVNHVATHGTLYIAMGKHFLTSADASIWVNRSTSITEDTINGLAWNGSKFVGVGFLGNTYSSADGINWSEIAVSAVPFSDITWNGSNFVLVGQDGLILTSPDATNASWTVRTTGTTNDFMAVTSNGGSQLVAVGGTSITSPGGLIRTSNDNGVTWVNNDNLGLVWRDVTWNGSKYAAVSSNGTIITSSDGATWATVVIGTSNSYIFTSITSSGDSNNFVAVGQNLTGDILTSNDNGVTWVERTSNVYSGFSAVSWNGTQFMAAGIGVIITSSDGITWTPQDVITGAGIYGIEWDGSQYVMVGSGNVIIRGGN